MKRILKCFISIVLSCSLLFSTILASDELNELQGTDVIINGGEHLDLYMGPENEYTLSYSFSLEGYTEDVKAWTSGDTTIATVDENGIISPVALGSTYISLETINGLTDTIDITVNERPLIVENQVVETSGELNDPQILFYRFSPLETGVYIIDIEYDRTKIGGNGVSIYEEGVEKALKHIGDSTSIKHLYEIELQAGKMYHIGSYLRKADGASEHTMTISTKPATPAPTEEPTLNEDWTKTVEVTDSGNNNTFVFVPDETGIYRYTSKGSYDVQGMISDESNVLAISDNVIREYGQYRLVGNFTIECKLEAGKKYFLNSATLSTNTGSYTIQIEKNEVATGIQIGTQEAITVKKGVPTQLSLYYSPEDARDEIISWTSDNEYVVKVDKDGKIVGGALGTANITVKTATGLTDTISVNIIDHPEITEENHGSGWSMSGSFYYKFVPTKDSYYEIKTECESGMFNSFVTVYDDSFTSLDSEINAISAFEMAKGKAYYIKVEPATDCIGDSVILTVVDKSAGAPVTPGPIATPMVTDIPGPTEVPNYTETPGNVVFPIPTYHVRESSLYPFGDISRDNVVNAEDALIVLKVAAKLVTIDEDHSWSGDVNRDAWVDAEDALQMLKVAAKLDVFTANYQTASNTFYIKNFRDRGAYIWTYTVSDEDKMNVSVDIIEVPPAENGEPIIGIMGERQYTINVSEKGRYTIEFRLVPIGSENEPPIEVIRYELYSHDV